VVLLLACTRWGDVRAPGPWLVLVPAVTAVFLGLAASSSALLSRVSPGPLVTVVALLALTGSCLVSLLVRGYAAELAFWVFVLIVVGIGSAYVVSSHHHSDVYVYMQHSTHALVTGRDPYAQTFPNPYSAAETRGFFGPGLVVGDRLDFGYPYLPASLLLYLPGLLLGDVRVVSVLALAACAVVLRRLSRDQVGDLLAFAPLTAPILPKTLEMGWNEPALAVFLLAAVVSVSRGGPAWIPLGLLLASKQYLVVTVPVLFVAGRVGGRSLATRSLGLAAVVVAVFLAWDPHGFVRSAIRLHLQQPYRTDSISLVVAWGNTYGRLPDWTYGLPPLLLGLAVSLLVARRAAPGPSALALGVGLSVLGTVLLSKQAFPNYFLFVEIAVVTAVVVWPGTGRPASDEATAAREVPVGAGAGRTPV
jgi:hypothetical protein